MNRVQSHIILYSLATFLVLVSVARPSGAQDIAKTTLEWNTVEATDERSQGKFNHQSVFRTHGTDRVVWLQKNGTHTTTYQIASVEGEWLDVSKSGAVVFHLRHDGKKGLLSVERTAAGIFLTLDFSQSFEFGVKQRFKIQSVTAL